jgi:nucleoside-diphosphate-sugar epimerase
VNILVTGAAGFIGSHLAERLAALGHSVRGLDCFTDFYSRALKQLNADAIAKSGVQMVPRDLAQDDLKEALHDIDIVYHAAAQPGLSPTASFETYARNNLTATYRLVEAARQVSSLGALIYISTSSVYGSVATGSESSEPKPTSYYGVTKLAGEQLVLAHHRDADLPACSLRLFSVYGPRERPDKLYSKLIRSILQDTPFPLYEGSEDHVRSYTYIDDAIEGLVSVLQCWDRCVGEIFNIGTDGTITTGQGIRIIEDIIGRPARIERMPKRAGDQLRTQADIRKARRVLGYDPVTAPQEGLVKQVAWYQEHVWARIH